MVQIHHNDSSAQSLLIPLTRRSLVAENSGPRKSTNRALRPVMPSDFPPRAPHINIPTPDPTKKCPIPNSPVKKDAFLPTNCAPILGPLELDQSVSSDSDAASVEPQSQFCPCCKVHVNLHGMSYHNHLVWCLKGTKAGPKRFSARDDKKKIKDIRGVISKLDLHLRIGIMESFYRMSRGVTNSEPPSPRLLPTSGTNAEANDKQVLALLYGKRVGSVQRMKNRRKHSSHLKLPRQSTNVIAAVRSVSLTKPHMKPRHLNLGASTRTLNTDTRISLPKLLSEKPSLLAPLA
uniref:Uncharacterized protein n=1 Tax=Lotharella globosa TaxID=91324 RepID=A0A6V3UPC7_9EUKA|mmetsp:Transcript_13804/g.27937  ORF Transcript_13804/g.27937 Transcript_13804/m.27937 type:complete len:291 (+) Transcript_13804:59-931(+)